MPPAASARLASTSSVAAAPASPTDRVTHRPAATLPVLAAVPTPNARALHPARTSVMYLAETPVAPHHHRPKAAYRCPVSRNKPSVSTPPTSPAASASPSLCASVAPGHPVHAPRVGACVGAAHDPNPNFRRHMEDAVLAHVCHELPAAFVAVYDGHGGATVAHYLRQLLHTVFLDELLAPSPSSSPASKHAAPPSPPRSPASPVQAVETRALDSSSVSSSGDEDTLLDASAAFRRSYRRMDRILAERRCLRVGATAVTAFLSRRANGTRVLTVANVGDSRAVLCRGGRAVRLGDEHRPCRADERARIEQAGGFVMSGRVNGVLNVARAFGDHCMKRLVVCTPAVTELPLGPMDDFVVLACDGLWDVMDDADVVRAAQLAFDRGLGPQAVARELVREAIDRRSTDNVSVVVVQLHPDDEE